MQFSNQYPGQDNAEDFADDTNLTPSAEDSPVEGDWNDEEDEDFDDQMELEEDMREIRTADDLGEPDPEDDDHMPDGDMQ
ncbi:hypothetical protein [Mucilaginibacter aquariorum]|uniref:Adhesin n=1 Tax=Mucilaginibacter aquariorum TaxID=2967225 RepID=A0ABT1T1Z2_9SPHI|nr:hypothetical protein [Mucilaginibacter aquariorum]MCQ6958630.1 hypothetical protein [Mucilaginibacter aquariorum]